MPHTTVPFTAATALLLLGIITDASGPPAPADIVMHPRFAHARRYEIVDWGTWHASYYTSVRGLPDALEPFALSFSIEHLADKRSFQLDLAIQCKPGAAETKLQYILPFKFSGETLCKDTIPFKIINYQSMWHTVDSQHMYYLVLRVKKADTGAGLEFKDVFKSHVRMRFGFRNDKWQLEANSLYLWCWDSIFKFNTVPTSAGSLPSYFLTEFSKDLLLTLRPASSGKSFDSIQFIRPQLAELVALDSNEYIQNYINMQAIMLLGVGVTRECHTSVGKYTTIFATKKADVTEQLDKLRKVAVLDPKTGRLTFSSYGLSSAMVAFYELSLEQKKFASTVNHFKLKICAGVDLTHTQRVVSAFKPIKEESNPSLHYKRYGSLHDDCQIVGSSSRTVTLFARSGINRLTCPIVCSNIEEPYLFYRGNVALTPNARSVRTYYINDSITAYKSGIAINIRADATYEDAGEYKCTAGGKTVTFDVRVVSMPSFSMQMHDKRKLIGSLPPRIYAVEGEGYEVSCAVYFSGIHSATLAPEFRLKTNSPDGKFAWKKQNEAAFVSAAKADDLRCKIDISRTENKNMKSVTVAVRGIRREGRDRPSFFDHQMLCSTQASESDAQKYGLTDYTDQTLGDVHFVLRPRLDDFQVSVGQCCLQDCASKADKKCTLQVTMKKSTLEFLTAIKLKVSAEFLLRGAKLPSSADAKFDSTLASLSLKSPDAVASMSQQQLADFAGVTAVFRYQHSFDANRDGSFKLLLGDESYGEGDRHCLDERKCVFSTGFDLRLSHDISVAGMVQAQAEAESKPVPAWVHQWLSTSRMVV